MSKHAVMHDGTILEFPDETPDDVMDRAVHTHLGSVKSGRTGKSYAVNVPDGADQNATLDAAQAALRAQEPDTIERPVFGDSGTTAPPTAMEAIGGAAKDFATNLENGFSSLPDLASKAGSAISDGLGVVGRFLATGGGASSGTVGNPSSSDRMAGVIDPPHGPAPTMRGVNAMVNPGAYDRSNAGFLTEMLGAGLMPIGPKAAPRAISAPRTASAVEAAFIPAQSKRLIPKAVDVVQAGKDFKVPVMTSDIRPPVTFMGKAARATAEKILFAGTGRPRSAQQAARTDAAEKLISEYGDGGGAIDAVAADLAKTRGDELSKYTGIKTRIIEGIPGAVPAPKAVAAISQQITRLQGINADAFAPVIAKLKNFEEVLQSGKSLAEVEGNRKLLGDLFADQNLAAIKGDGQKALNAIYGPLREDMGVFIEAQAGKPAAARWTAANERLAAMMGELKSAAFAKVLQKADTTPETAAQVIFSKTPSDMRRLYANLSVAGKAKAQAAIIWNAAQGATEKEAISPQKFANALAKMDASTGVFFEPIDKARLDGFVRLIKATQRASEAGAMPETGMQNVPIAIAGGLGAVFGKAAIPIAITIGGLARTYESSIGRRLFVRLSKTQPGSAEESAVLKSLAPVIARLVPVAANDTGGFVSGAAGQSPLPAVAGTQSQQVKN